MTNTLFVSETKLRQFTDMNNNVDSELIKNAIREAQDIEVQRLLGTRLYKRIIAGIIADDLTADETSLLNDYIADTTIYWSYYYCLDAIYIRPRNNGILRANGGENSEAVDITLYDRKRKAVLKKAEWYSELMATYLVENRSTFPLLDDNDKLYEKNPDYGSQYARNPFVMRNRSRGQWQNRGLPITDSSRPFTPPSYYDNC